MAMMPSDIKLPLFAYGLFQPGQPAFLNIKDSVEQAALRPIVSGELRERDGLPLYFAEGGDALKGTLVVFKPDRAREAYERIAAMHPEFYYEWTACPVQSENARDPVYANVLSGKGIRKAFALLDHPEWDGNRDPLLREGLEVIRETMDRNASFNLDYRRFFRLKAAYLLLWKALFRYARLRYDLSPPSFETLRRLAGEPGFERHLRGAIREKRETFSLETPERVYVLDPADPAACLEYYREVANLPANLGRAAFLDFRILRDSLLELYQVFVNVKYAAFTESRRIEKTRARIRPEQMKEDDKIEAVEKMACLLEKSFREMDSEKLSSLNLPLDAVNWRAVAERFFET
jgi:hypothetical protein